MLKLRPHQLKAVEELSNGKILWGDVGTGKSLTAIGYYALRESPKDIYIITTAKKRDSLDWEGEAVRFGIGTERDATVHGVLKVDSWNNIGKYEGVKDAFFIFDEQRLVGSGTWTDKFYKIAKHNNWILLTATPGDTWLDYIPVFVANGWYKNRTEFKRRHVVYNTFAKFPKVDHYVEVGTLIKLRNRILVHMPYERHTVRHNHFIEVDYDHELYDKVVNKRWHVYEKRPLRDVGELFSVMRKVVNSDESRIRAVRQLMERHPRLIVFYNFDYELEMLRTLKWNDSEPSTSSSKSQSNGRWVESPDNKGELWIPNDPASGLTIEEAAEWLTSEGMHHSETELLSSTTDTHSSDGRTRRLTSSKPSGLSTSYDGTATILSQANGMDQISNQTQQDLIVDAQGVGFDSSSLGTDSPTTKLMQSSEKDSDTTLSSRNESSSIFEIVSQTPTSEQTNGDETTQFSQGSFAVGEWNGHKHEEIPKTERWVYLVQYVAGSEGWNCTVTNAVCFFSQTYSYKNYHQAHGRIDRLNTPYVDLHYYNLRSKAPIDQAIGKSLDNKQSFQEVDFAHGI